MMISVAYPSNYLVGASNFSQAPTSSDGMVAMVVPEYDSDGNFMQKEVIVDPAESMQSALGLGLLPSGERHQIQIALDDGT
mmetsp:Transcript_25298/g.31673  ORF Transcript_25298/g.31673 Transcript_25298/m.31673 type:complete len:81 (+) Transcript_25298:323-565(+)